MPRSISYRVGFPRPGGGNAVQADALALSDGTRFDRAAALADLLGLTDVGVLTSRALLVPGVDKPSTAGNSGLLPGTSLATYSGATNITTAGALIQNQDIFLSPSIRAANVVMDNCRVRGTVGASYLVDCTNSAASNFTMTNCELVPDTPSHNYNAVQGHHMTIKWCDIHDTVDGINFFNTNAGNVLQGLAWMNYIHDLSYWSPDTNHADNMSHNDGIQIQGGVGPLKIQGNLIDSRDYSATSGNFATAPDRGTGTITNGRYAQGQLTCIQFTDFPTDNYTVSTSPSALVEIYDNFLYGGYRSLAAGSADSNLGKWHRNIFDDAQGLRQGGSLSAKQGYTILVDALVTVDTGDGTANANIYESDSSEVTVRHNG